MQSFPADADCVPPAPRRPSARRPRAAAGIALAALLAGCARDGAPRTFAVPSAAAARIRMVCPPGSFVGTMTVNCPQILPAAPR